LAKVEDSAMLRHFAVAGLLIEVFAAAPLSGQHASVPLEQWESSGSFLAPAPDRTGVEPDTVLAPRRDYRYEGLLIGGLVLGVAGAWAGSQISGGCALSPGNSCYNDKVGTAVGLGLLSAVVGGGFGYLIGRLSPKLPARDSLFPSRRSLDSASIPDSVRQRVGYQHWRGGALGLTIGAAVGVATGAILDGGCSDCGHQRSGALSAGLVGAGAGGLLGFFAGLASPKYKVIRTSNSEP
jgi:hypothetical protein